MQKVVVLIHGGERASVFFADKATALEQQEKLMRDARRGEEWREDT